MTGNSSLIGIREGLPTIQSWFGRALGQIEFGMPFMPFRLALVGVRQRKNG